MWRETRKIMLMVYIFDGSSDYDSQVWVEIRFFLSFDPFSLNLFLIPEKVLFLRNRPSLAEIL